MIAARAARSATYSWRHALSVPRAVSGRTLCSRTCCSRPALGALLAARAAHAPLVVMAHGQDVANLDRAPLRAASAPVFRGAGKLIANSRWLAARIPRTVDAVIDCGVDLEAFAPRPRGADPYPHFLCVGSLTARKQVVPLADAFARFGEGRLTFVGDGPLRSALDGRPGVELVGRVPHEQIPAWIARADVVCQPSLTEPFGQALLESMAMERAVIGTINGGPPEFVTREAGVLVDPADPGALLRALSEAVSLGAPVPAARAAAAEHDVHRQAARMADVLRAAVPGG